MEEIDRECSQDNIFVIFSAAHTNFTSDHVDFSTRLRTRRCMESLSAYAKDCTSAFIFSGGFGGLYTTKQNWRGRRKEDWRRFRAALLVLRTTPEAKIVLHAKRQTFGERLALFAAVGLARISGGARITIQKSANPKKSKFAAALDMLRLQGKAASGLPVALAFNAVADQLDNDTFKIRQCTKHLSARQGMVWQSLLTALANEDTIMPLCEDWSHHFAGQQQDTALFEKHLAQIYSNAPNNMAFAKSALENAWPLAEAPSPDSIDAALKVKPDTPAQAANFMRIIYFAVRLGKRVEAEEWFAPCDGESGLPRIAMVLACLLDCTLNDLAHVNQPWRAPEIAEWYRALCLRFPALSHNQPTKPNVLPRLRIFGIENVETGLGRNQKMLSDALATASANATHILRPSHLHCLNADSIPQSVWRSGASREHQIGFLLWEHAAVPAAHDLAGNMLDDIWAPTRFVADIYRRHYGREVFQCGKAITLPDVAPAFPPEYNIQQESTVFLTCLDAPSGVERKNPLAAVKAFVKAFPERDSNHRLIVKSTPLENNDWADPFGQLAKIAKIAGRDPRIIFDTRSLPFEALLAMIRASDGIIAPHRGEGFGYIPAYALYYARPVIVTDWSGTRDFCTQQTAYPVRYKMIDTPARCLPFPAPPTQWPEIDQTALAAAIRSVASDPAHALAKARRGQQFIHTEYSEAALAQRIKTRLVETGILAP